MNSIHKRCKLTIKIKIISLEQSQLRKTTRFYVEKFLLVYLMFKVVKSTKVYESDWIRLYEELKDTGNNNFQMYNKISTRDTALVVPVFDDGRVLIVENYRHGVSKRLLELPGGWIEAEEEPVDAARRELLEETGYASEKFEEILNFYTWPGRSTQKSYVFRAKGLSKRFNHKLDSETISVIRLSRRQVRDEIKHGRIRAAPTIAAIWAAYLSEKTIYPVRKR